MMTLEEAHAQLKICLGFAESRKSRTVLVGTEALRTLVTEYEKLKWMLDGLNK